MALGGGHRAQLCRGTSASTLSPTNLQTREDTHPLVIAEYGRKLMRLHRVHTQIAPVDAHIARRPEVERGVGLQRQS